MAYRNYGVANGFTVNKNGQGDFTSITAALAVATSGNVVYLYPGIYTENFTLPAGVDIVALGNNSLTPTVTIVGKITVSNAGNNTLTGINLKNSGDFGLVVSGAGLINLDIYDCFVTCNNHNYMSYTNSNSSTIVTFYNSDGDILNTGITYFISSAVFTLRMENCNFRNSIGSTTQSTFSNGPLNLANTTLNVPIATSSSSFLVMTAGSVIQTNNVTAYTHTGGGSPATLYSGVLNSGTASVVYVGDTSTVIFIDMSLYSTNANCITGGVAKTGVAKISAIEWFSAGNQHTIATNTAAFPVTLGDVTVIGLIEMLSGTTLQIDSGAVIDVQAGAKLQIDASAEIDVPLAGLLVGNSAGFAVTSLPLLSNGTIPIGGAGGPVAANLIAGTGMTIVNGPNSITLNASSAGFTWNNVTSGPVTLVAENGYFINSGSLITLVLPSIASSNLGDTIKIIGLGAGGWTITQLALEQINVAGDSTTAGIGGSVSSTNRGDCIELVYSPTSGLWVAEDFVGNLSIV